MKVYVNYHDARWTQYKIDFNKIAKSAVDASGRGVEVSITLTNDDEIHMLNKQYRGIDKPTNVLSFELGDDMLLGDIYISLDTVQREADAANISVAEHTAHMVVHGMLHLQGYDHLTDAQADVMEGKEIVILEKLGIKNPYLDDAGIMCNDALCCPGGHTIAWLQKFVSCAWVRYVGLALLGAMAALGFAPFNMWWFTVFGICGAYWIMLNHGQGSLWRVFLRVLPFSGVYAVAMFWWVLHSIYVVPELAAQFAVWTVPGLVGIGIAGGVIFALPFVAMSRVRAESSARPFIFAGLWTFVLWLREWLLTGFPWNPIANIAMPNIYLANSMSLWGALGLTFVIIGCCASVVEVLRRRYKWQNLVTLGVFVMLGIIGALYGVHNIRYARMQNNMSPVIRVVQPAQSAAQKATHSRAAALQNAEYNVRNLMTLATVESVPDLVVFPETAYPFMMVDNQMPMASALRTNIIIGATSYKDNSIYNSMVVATPDGVVDTLYSKSHLVPFGEYRPLGDIIPTPGQLTPGDGPTEIAIDLGTGAFRFVPAICYEIIFTDSLVRRDAGNVDAIINITNDTWFGNMPGTYQHLDMVRRYAIESGLPVVRANYSGVSAFIASDGGIISAIPVGQAGYMDGTIWGAHNTMYRQIGRDWWMIILLCIACCGAITMSWLSRRK